MVVVVVGSVESVELEDFAKFVDSVVVAAAVGSKPLETFVSKISR